MKYLAVCIAFIALATGAAFANGGRSETEIKKLRTEIVKAIKEKNKKFLESRIADEFTHTHASGKVDDKKTRIEYLVSGEETIDSLTPETISIRSFGKDLAIAQGRTKTSGTSPKTFQWTVVYRKSSGVWQMLLSQASPVVE